MISAVCSQEYIAHALAHMHELLRKEILYTAHIKWTQSGKLSLHRVSVSTASIKWTREGQAHPHTHIHPPPHLTRLGCSGGGTPLLPAAALLTASSCFAAPGQLFRSSSVTRLLACVPLLVVQVHLNTRSGHRFNQLFDNVERPSPGK